jgi:hypothetical protein
MFRAEIYRKLSAAGAGGKEEMAAIDAILNRHRPSPNGDGTAKVARQ